MIKKIKYSYIYSRVIIAILLAVIIFHLITVIPLFYKPLVVCDERNPIAANPMLGGILVLVLIFGIVTFYCAAAQLINRKTKNKIGKISIRMQFLALGITALITLVVEFNHSFQLCF